MKMTKYDLEDRLLDYSAQETSIARQTGSAMLLTLLILSILTLVGLLAARTTTTEVCMAVNDMRHKLAFFTAEGTAELVSEILEQSITCPGGQNRWGSLAHAESPDFWKNKPEPGRLPTDDDGNGSPVRDLRIPADGSDDAPHTNVVIGGSTRLAAGNALQTASGYEGSGRSLAGSGAHIVYDQVIQHVGSFNTEALVRIQWRHVIGMEGNCSP